LNPCETRRRSAKATMGIAAREMPGFAQDLRHCQEPKATKQSRLSF
jgi:hypothetical protein